MEKVALAAPKVGPFFGVEFRTEGMVGVEFRPEEMPGMALTQKCDSRRQITRNCVFYKNFIFRKTLFDFIKISIFQKIKSLKHKKLLRH